MSGKDIVCTLIATHPDSYQPLACAEESIVDEHLNLALVKGCLINEEAREMKILTASQVVGSVAKALCTNQNRKEKERSKYPHCNRFTKLKHMPSTYWYRPGWEKGKERNKAQAHIAAAPGETKQNKREIALYLYSGATALYGPEKSSGGYIPMLVVVTTLVVKATGG